MAFGDVYKRQTTKTINPVTDMMGESAEYIQYGSLLKLGENTLTLTVTPPPGGNGKETVYTLSLIHILKDMDSGLVKLATFSSVSAQWLPRILKSFGKVYPNIEFEVVTGDFYDQIEDWIVNGTVDCGFNC